MDISFFGADFEKCRQRLVDTLLPRVRNLDVAEDITSAAFQAAWEHRGGFRGDASFFTWVYRIAFNEAVQWRRREKPERFESMDTHPEMALAVREGTDHTLERCDSCLRLREVLRRIPAMYRRVLMDHFVRGHSTKQMAKEQHIPLGTVLSRLFNGKRLLRRKWEAIR